MTKPIPDGYPTITPHLIVRGADRAIEFYGRAFGAETKMRLPGPDGGVMHAEIRIGSSPVMLAEENEKWGSKSPLRLGGTPVTLNVYTADCDATYARALAAGAKSIMPPADMFWGDRYAQVGDPFGHTWAIHTHQKDLTQEQILAAMQEQFGGKPCE